jgi:hypothetical protein
VNEPLAVISAMAAATNSIGFGVTVSTTYEQPYHLARRLSTIDHLSKGRLGWNVSARSKVKRRGIADDLDRNQLSGLCCSKLGSHGTTAGESNGVSRNRSLSMTA